jgi:hypothetical protein
VSVWYTLSVLRQWGDIREVPLPETPKFVVRIPLDLRAQLQEIADAQHRRLTNLIIHALREWLAGRGYSPSEQK